MEVTLCPLHQEAQKRRAWWHRLSTECWGFLSSGCNSVRVARNPSVVLEECFCIIEMNKPLKRKRLKKCLAQKALTGVICRILDVTGERTCDLNLARQSLPQFNTNILKRLQGEPRVQTPVEAKHVRPLHLTYFPRGNSPCYFP